MCTALLRASRRFLPSATMRCAKCVRVSVRAPLCACVAFCHSSVLERECFCKFVSQEIHIVRLERCLGSRGALCCSIKVIQHPFPLKMEHVDGTFAIQDKF